MHHDKGARDSVTYVQAENVTMDRGDRVKQ